MYLFEGTTADEVWLKAASEFANSDGPRVQPSRGGDTKELMGTAFTIKDPRQRWIVSRQPPINPAFALAEVVWIMSGRRDSAFLNYWNPRLPEFAGTARKYHGAYGFRLRRHFGLDQLDRAYEALKSNPDTRQVVLQIWDASVDMPLKDGSPIDRDIPCNVCSFAKIRDGKLQWTQIVRSNDLFLGVPHNFVQFTTLQELLAAWLGIDVGDYRHVSDCLHIYVRDERNVSNSIASRSEPNNDQLSFDRTESDVFFGELSSRMNRMAGAFLTQKKLRSLVRTGELPTSLRNWLLVVGADCARRRKWMNLCFEFMAECSNPVFNQMWDRWLGRWQAARIEEMVAPEALIHIQPSLSFGAGSA